MFSMLWSVRKRWSHGLNDRQTSPPKRRLQVQNPPFSPKLYNNNNNNKKVSDWGRLLES